MRHRILTGLFLFSLMICSFGCGGANATYTETAGNKLTEDKYFSLRDLNGNEVNLKAELAKHKAVVVNFWATWCPPCREEIPDLIKLQEQYGANGFTILGVDIGESHKKVSNFAKKMNMTYPVLLDSDESAASAYGIVGIPTSLLVKSDGTIVGEYHSVSKKMQDDVAKILAS